MYHRSGFSFWTTHKVFMISLLFTHAYVIAQETVSVLKDSSQVLPCEHNVSDVGSVTWKKGGTVLIQGFISNGQHNIVVDSMPDKTELLFQNGSRVSHNMRLDNIDFSDEGSYSCEVTEHGTGAQTTLTSVLFVRVQPSAPAVQVQYDPQPSDMSSVPLNTTVTFTCTSTGGRPPATLTWSVTEIGTLLAANPTFTSSTSQEVGPGDATSRFSFTTAIYGLTYMVECVASGPDPIQTQRSALTNFTTEPELNSVSICYAAGPATGYVGGTFNATCTAVSKPTASFNWTKQEDSSFIATGAILQISDLNVNHTGTYVCTAYNAYANDTASVQLTVEREPISITTPEGPTAELNTVSTQSAVTATGYVGEPIVSTMAPNTTTKGSTEAIVFRLEVVAGIGVGSLLVGFLLGAGAVCLILRCRMARNGGGNKDAGNPDDGQYENVAYSREASKRPGSGSDVPMETIEPPSQPPQPSDDYQELRPAIYQSLKKH